MANPRDILKTWGLREYLASLRAGIRAYYMGVFTRMEFVDHMFAMVRRGLAQAFLDGLKVAGIEEDEVTPEEQVALRRKIDQEYHHVLALSQFVAVAKEQQRPISYVFNLKVDLWGMRYIDTYNLAVTFGGGDPKLEWILGPTEHCRTCFALASKVKRLSVWKRYGYKPQADWHGVLPNRYLA